MYIPTVFDNYAKMLLYKGRPINLNLYDTSGQDAYDRLRPLSYPGTHVLLVCFSIPEPDTFQNVVEKWIPEVRHFCPTTPIVIVGNKLDKRNDPDVIRELSEMSKKPITHNEGQSLKIKCKAAAYVECSAKTTKGIADVFDTAVNSVLNPTPAPTTGTRKKRFCRFL